MNWKAARPRWPRSPGGGQIRGPRRTPAPSWSGCCSRRAPCTNGASRRPGGRSRCGRASRRTSPARPRRCPTPQHMTCSGSATPRAISGWPRPGTGTGELAAEAWELSRRVADGGLGHDQSRIARADSSLAALAAEAGRGPARHQAHHRRVLATRLALREGQPHDAANWRRLTVTERTRADIARMNGQVIEGVRLAADLVADRQARLGDSVRPIPPRPGSCWGRPCWPPVTRSPPGVTWRRPPISGAAGSCRPPTGSRRISSGSPRRRWCSSSRARRSSCWMARPRAPTGSVSGCRSGTATRPAACSRWPAADRPDRRGRGGVARRP